MRTINDMKTDKIDAALSRWRCPLCGGQMRGRILNEPNSIRQCGSCGEKFDMEERKTRVRKDYGDVPF